MFYSAVWLNSWLCAAQILEKLLPYEVSSSDRYQFNPVITIDCSTLNTFQWFVWISLERVNTLRYTWWTKYIDKLVTYFTHILEVKVKVELSMYLIKDYAMRMYGRLNKFHTLTSSLWLRYVLSFLRQPLYPQRKSPKTYQTGGRVNLRTGLNVMVMRKILFLQRIKPWLSSV
jgi:hypothetical protein